jgi:hypothetical protein
MIGCYLLVELVNIVGGLVLSLNEEWVLPYLLSCGHVGMMVVVARGEG